MDDKPNKNGTKKSRKESLVDTLSGFTYSLIVGGVIDYTTGLRGWGIASSRAYASSISAVTGGWYGKWRNFLFNKTNTTQNSHWFRKGFVDVLAGNTFQAPIYASAVAVGSLISDGHVDWHKVRDGLEKIVIISPLIAPTLGWYSDFVRKRFGLPSAAQRAGESK